MSLSSKKYKNNAINEEHTLYVIPILKSSISRLTLALFPAHAIEIPHGIEYARVIKAILYATIFEISKAKNKKSVAKNTT